MRNTLFYLMMILVSLGSICGLVGLSGCHRVSAAARAVVWQLEDKSAIQTASELAQIKSKLAVAEAKEKAAEQLAELNPVKHPIKAASNLVATFRTPTKILCIVSALLLVLSIGLRFTVQFSLIGKFGIRFFGSIAAATLCGLVFAPLLPLLIGIGFLAFVGEYIRLLIKTHSPALALKDEVSEVETAVEDLKPSTVASTSVTSTVSTTVASTAVAPPVTTGVVAEVEKIAAKVL